MRMYDLITKKKHGEALTDAEITYMIDGYVKGDIPDYQMSAMLMAIWFKGMTDDGSRDHGAHEGHGEVGRHDRPLGHRGQEGRQALDGRRRR